jgi:hypothetical protein
LPAASFRFHLAMDTLALRLAVPLIGPAKVFHLLGLRPAGRTKKKGGLIPALLIKFGGADGSRTHGL